MNLMTKLNNEELNKIRDVRIHQILGIKDIGRDVQIRCPFGSHRDKTPSCTIYSNNSYHCFSCLANGTGAIDFCKELGFTFTESLEELIKYIK